MGVSTSLDTNGEGESGIVTLRYLSAEPSSAVMPLPFAAAVSAIALGDTIRPLVLR